VSRSRLVPSGFHAKEIGGAVAIGGEDDRTAVGRPDRVVVDFAEADQGPFAAAVRVGDEQADLPGIRPHPREDNLLGPGGAGAKRQQGGEGQSGGSHGRILRRRV